MRKKLLSCIAVLFVVALLAPAQQAHCAAKTPEQFAGEFYTWLLQASADGNYPWDDDGMMQYVRKARVEAVRKGDRKPMDFLQVGMDYAWSSPVAHKGIPMANGMTVVPVSMKMAGKDWRVVVFVQQENEAMFIDYVTNIFPLLVP